MVTYLEKKRDENKVFQYFGKKGWVRVKE